MTPPASVLVIGCGLIGTSIALALREHGVDVHLDDTSRSNLELAVSRGAGSAEPVAAPDLVVVAVPPSGVVDTVSHVLSTWPDAVVTDVASVKTHLAARIAELPGSYRYVGSHPMAGSERAGPMAASARLFEGRPWAVTPMAGAGERSVRLIEAVAELVGAVPITMDAESHDRAVALVSHVPHVLSVLAAARLRDAPRSHLSLAGPGLRDVTRIAGSDTALWSDILRSNAGEVRALLEQVRADLEGVIASLGLDEPAVDGILESGRAGTRLIPGKHGERPIEFATVFVPIADHPGELSRLMAHTGESGVNIEDLRIDHELGRPVGLVEIAVLADRADVLVEALTARGWPAYR
ncbi:prephenate dehydrogenase [Aeromicrobium sp.]|uniref:prephenate dehydrogenase n=1 Tax=Aeromicrobium sp. TaxID=1871063 RepID=UPI003D6C52A7